MRSVNATFDGDQLCVPVGSVGIKYWPTMFAVVIDCQTTDVDPEYELTTVDMGIVDELPPMPMYALGVREKLARLLNSVVAAPPLNVRVTVAPRPGVAIHVYEIASSDPSPV